MTGWSSIVFKQNLLKALQNLRKLIRQYSADDGIDASGRPIFLLNRTVAGGGLAPLPGHRRIVRLGTATPEPCLPTSLPTAAQHRPIPLLPFAALPICCAVAIAATSAQCEPALDEIPPASEVPALVAESLLWEASVLRELADLRKAYDELTADPLWVFAMEGVKNDARESGIDQSLDPDDAIYELARMANEQAPWTRNQDVVETMDPLEALLELAQIGHNRRCIW